MTIYKFVTISIYITITVLITSIYKSKTVIDSGLLKIVILCPTLRVQI